MAGEFDWSDPAMIKERLAQQVADAEARAAEAARVREDIESIRTTATTGSGISVTVDATGRLLDLVIEERAMRGRAAALGKEILRAVVQAQQDAGARSIEIAAEAWGEDDGAVARLRDEVDRMPLADLSDGTQIVWR